MKPSDWTAELERLVECYSSGAYEKDLRLAQQIFFEKIGRIHENQSSIYESVSQSFLEYYLFHFILKDHAKPAVIVEWELGKKTDALQGFIFQTWSIFEVENISEDRVILWDLLHDQKRVLDREASKEWVSSWRPKKNQILQARLFEIGESDIPLYFCTTVWIHPETEWPDIKKICVSHQKTWGDFVELLSAFFEAHIRSFSLSDQMRASGKKNFFYQELFKKYA